MLYRNPQSNFKFQKISQDQSLKTKVSTKVALNKIKKHSTEETVVEGEVLDQEREEPKDEASLD